MPVPVFIICSEGGSIDRHTNQLSIFDVIEKITFLRLEGPAPAAPNLRLPGIEEPERPVAINSLRMTAVWRQGEGDAGAEFEFKTTVRIPGVPEEINAGEGRFIFKTSLHRLIATVHSDLPPQSGELLVRNAVRRVGENAWAHQDYVIPVERLEPSANQPALPLS